MADIRIDDLAGFEEKTGAAPSNNLIRLWNAVIGEDNIGNNDLEDYITYSKGKEYVILMHDGSFHFGNDDLNGLTEILKSCVSRIEAEPAIFDDRNVIQMKMCVK